MAKFEIPPKENFTKQVITSIVILILVAIAVAILSRVIVGLVVFLLGSIVGVGSQVMTDNPLDKDS